MDGHPADNSGRNHASVAGVQDGDDRSGAGADEAFEGEVYSAAWGDFGGVHGGAGGVEAKVALPEEVTGELVWGGKRYPLKEKANAMRLPSR